MHLQLFGRPRLRTPGRGIFLCQADMKPLGRRFGFLLCVHSPHVNGGATLFLLGCLVIRGITSFPPLLLTPRVYLCLILWYAHIAFRSTLVAYFSLGKQSYEEREITLSLYRQSSSTHPRRFCQNPPPTCVLFMYLEGFTKAPWFERLLLRTIPIQVYFRFNTQHQQQRYIIYKI